MKHHLNRRRFLKQAATVAAVAVAPGTVRLRAAEKRRPRILLRSSWQTVNIGDIAHTPGVLRLLEEHVPEADVTLWPRSVDNGVREMLLARFPKLAIVEGDEAVNRAFAENDFFLHGSGPSVVASKDMGRWARETKKPYGVYGTTIGWMTPSLSSLLSGAKFVYCRDSVSLEFIKKQGVKAPIMEFGPDGAFATDVRNDAAAEKFLADNGLEKQKFLCVIPRFRHTPYWTIAGKNREPDQEKITRNEEMKEHDIAPLRAAVEEVVRKTDLKVLVCPEDQTQIKIGKEMIVDKLSGDVLKKVVWRDRYWLTDEALSTYLRSAGMFGLEMHTPIMCVGNGVPAIVGRFAEQTSKGYMWRDIGLGDWLFDFDQEQDIARYVPTVLAMAQDHPAAVAKAAKAREFVLQRQRETMAEVRRAVGL